MRVLFCVVNVSFSVLAVYRADVLLSLKQAAQLLEEVSAELLVHLESKRLYFPRLFFLSDDQLLDVLSHTKLPEKVEPYLRSLFDGIAKVCLLSRCAAPLSVVFVSFRFKLVFVCVVFSLILA